MKKRTMIAGLVLMVLVGGMTLFSASRAQAANTDPFSAILSKLDDLLTATGESAAKLDGIPRSWDTILPANDPGGPCPSHSTRFTCVLGGAAVRDN